MSQKTLAEQTIIHLEKANPQMRTLWRPDSARFAYRLAGGRGRVERGGEPMIVAAALRLYSRLAGCSVTPEQLPILCLSTCSPNAVTVFHKADGSFAIGIDQALFAWQAVVMMLLLEAERRGYRDALLIEKLMAFCDMMISQRVPDHIPLTWRSIWGIGLHALQLRHLGRRWQWTTVPLGIAWCDFILAHELGHIEMGHLAGGSCRLVDASPIPGACLTSFFGDQREFDADNWAIARCRETEPQRELDAADFAFIRHWGLREIAVRALRVHIIETSVRLSFLLWGLIEDLFPNTSKTHPPSLARLSNLALGTDSLAPEPDALPKDFRLVGAVQNRLVRLRQSDLWRQAINRPVK
jgi:hypothetical protein